MLKLGIIGSDNSHAVAYSRLTNIEGVLGDRARVTAITGTDLKRTREVAELGQIVEIADDPADLAARVDAVLVVDRHGDLHRERALPAIATGHPVYVDKPLAIQLDDAVAMIRAARGSGSLFTSFSPLRVAPATVQMAADIGTIGDIRHGQFTGPCDFASVYGGPFFYATHTLEIACRVLGDDLTSLRATRSLDTVTVNVSWASGITGTIDYVAKAGSYFHGTVIGTDGYVAGELVAGDLSYRAALVTIVDMIAGDCSPLAPAQILTPIAAVHAIQQSLAGDGAEIDVAELAAPYLAQLDNEPATIGGRLA